mmetsp:Transcript_2034/g.3110  ORF Transcript_2034/g.3110 Transcript_2034/m.3110 type:complete len:369 (-) Transcript_2034:518-1624(-)
MVQKKRRRVIGLIAEEDYEPPNRPIFWFLLLLFCSWYMAVKSKQCTNKVHHVSSQLEKNLREVGGQDLAKAQVLRVVARQKPVRLCMTSSASGSGKSLFAELIATSFYGLESRFIEKDEILSLVLIGLSVAALFSSPIFPTFFITLIGIAIFLVRAESDAAVYPEQCGIAWFSGEIQTPLTKSVDAVVVEHFNGSDLHLSNNLSLIVIETATNASCPRNFARIELQPLQGHALDDAIAMITERELATPIRSNALASKGLRWLGAIELDESLRKQIHADATNVSNAGGHAVHSYFRDIDLMPALDVLFQHKKQSATSNDIVLANLLLIMKTLQQEVVDHDYTTNNHYHRYTFEWKIIDLLSNKDNDIRL